jgi:hypothetical protein
MSAGDGGYPLGHAQPDVVNGNVRFTINGTSNPDGIVDRGNLITSTIVRNSAGVFTMTLTDTYADIEGHVNVRLVGFDGKVTAVSAGAAANTVQVTTNAANGNTAADPTDNAVVSVFLELYRIIPQT